MTINIDKFLHAKGFHGNPFETTTAEQEIEDLFSYFVQVDFFNNLVSDVQNPKSSILFASQGHGKTSHRFEVARTAAACTPPALVVTFSDFDILLHSGIQTFPAEAYLPVIRRKILESLINQLVWDAERREQLQQNSEVAARVCALQQLYAKPIEVISPPKQTTSWVEYYQQNFTVVEWLTKLVDIVQQAGFASVYLLVDGVDEWTETQQDPILAVNLLKPLLEIAFKSQILGFACKFFLPDYLEERIRQDYIINIDLVPVYRLKWTDRHLRKILSRRLISYSVGNETESQEMVDTFNRLIENKNDLHDLINEAHGSPRSLIKLANEIIAAHCHDYDINKNLLINSRTIRKVLYQWNKQVERTEHLKFIRDMIERIEVQEHSTEMIINIHGISGIGKTSFLRQMFDYLRQDYAIILLGFDLEARQLKSEGVFSWKDVLKSFQRLPEFSVMLNQISLEDNALKSTQDVDLVCNSVLEQLEQKLAGSKPFLLLLDDLDMIDDTSYWKWVQQKIIKPLIGSARTLIVATSQSPLGWHFWELRERCKPIELTPFSLDEVRGFLRLFEQEILTESIYKITSGYPLGLHYIIHLIENEEVSSPFDSNSQLLERYRYGMLKRLRPVEQYYNKVKISIDIEFLLRSIVDLGPYFDLKSLHKKLNLPPVRVNNAITSLNSRGFFEHNYENRTYQLKPLIRTNLYP